MASFFRSFHLGDSGALILIFSLLPWFSVSSKVEIQSILTPPNEIESQTNMTLSVYDPSTGCYCQRQSEYCDRYRHNTFTLAPEVCLTFFADHGFMRIEKVPQCVGPNGTISPLFVAYAGPNCTGSSMGQPLRLVAQCIVFPYERPYTDLPYYSSIIFHCHPEQYNRSEDPFEWQDTMGGKLQKQIKPHIPLELCEERLPTINDGSLSLNLFNNSCRDTGVDPHKSLKLPIDTCQSTYGAKGLKLSTPAVCKNDSRAKLARYFDAGCKHLSDMTDVVDEDMVWNGCRLLNDTTPTIGSVAFYCEGFDDNETSLQESIEATKTKHPTDLALTPEPTTISPIPKRPWVPFWQGLILVDTVQRGAPGGEYLSPRWHTMDKDVCFFGYQSPLRIYQVPRCWNLTRARIAFFTWDRCKGTPTFYDGNSKEVLEDQYCMSSSTGYGSFAFWCGGVKGP